jgi:hypothetical protein
VDKLLSLSAMRRKEAEQILMDGKVIKTLSKYGVPEIIGSYALNVMYDSDIDIVVFSKNPRENSLAALKDFILQRKFQKYEYGDFVKFKRINRPEGFIVNLHSNTQTVKWEIEIWFLKSINKEKKLNEFLKKEITEKRKIKILKLKHERATKKLSKYDLSSMDIYRKVIKEKF